MTAQQPVCPAPYYDQRIKGDVVFVLPGFHYVSAKTGVAVSTLLGSCVSACLRDEASNLGGLNHFLLPHSSGQTDTSQSARYGIHAMEVLINDLIKRGAQKQNLVAKIFGGANVIATSTPNPIGQQNATFVKDYLTAEGIPIIASDLGGSRARRIYFFPETGRVSVLLVNATDHATVQAKEIELRHRNLGLKRSGGVELF